MASVIYFHGFASGTQGGSPKTALIQDLGYQVELIATNGDYRPGGYLAAFQRLDLDPQVPLVLMGTSLGGFWARRLGNLLGKPWLVLNPAVQPSRSLRRYIGPNTRFDNGEPFNWTEADCTSYVAEEHFPVRDEVPGMILLAADDEVLNYRLTLAVAGVARVLVLPRGGHQLHNTADYGAAVAEFLEAATGDAPASLTASL